MDWGAPGTERRSRPSRYARSPFAAPVAGASPSLVAAEPAGSPVPARPPAPPPAPRRVLEASSPESPPGGRASAFRTMRAGYAYLSAAAGLFSLLMGALGETGYLVLFGSISLYFLRRVAGLRTARAGGVPGGDGERRSERGGFPLAVIAVASILLALSAASFAMNAAAINDPEDGICDYDRTQATAVYPTAGNDGTVMQRRELCDAHTGYFLVANPLHPYDLIPTARGGVTYRGRPVSFWAPIFSGLWAVFVLFMLAASVNIASPAPRWEPLFVVCSLARSIVAMGTGFVATLLFLLVSADLAALLGRVQPNWLLYVAMMVVFVAFLAAFFRRRGGAG